MAHSQDQDPNSKAGIGRAGETLKDTLTSEGEGASRAFSETAPELSEKAAGLASEAKEAALGKAEEAKEGLGSSLKAFGGALRAAGDHLAQGDQPLASRLVGEAADSLERFSGSLECKPLGEVIEELRTLGRNNAGGLFAGSLVAGLALGRLWRSAGSDDSQPSSGGLSPGDRGMHRGRPSADAAGASDQPARPGAGSLSGSSFGGEL